MNKNWPYSPKLPLFTCKAALFDQPVEEIEADRRAEQEKDDAGYGPLDSR